MDIQFCIEDAIIHQNSESFEINKYENLINTKTEWDYFEIPSVAIVDSEREHARGKTISENDNGDNMDCG